MFIGCQLSAVQLLALESGERTLSAPKLQHSLPHKRHGQLWEQEGVLHTQQRHMQAQLERFSTLHSQ
jgi:hypothetical protein